MNRLDDRVQWNEDLVPARPVALLARDAFLGEVARRLGRPGGLPGDVPLDMLGLDHLERYLVLVLLTEFGAHIDETLASVFFTLDDIYEQYALAAVGSP
jgi:hypothetical protein